jgi:UDP-glucose 4-epimerase
MKILVTGGAGFIGSHVVDKLIERENEVVVVDNLSTGKKENLNPKASFYELNIESEKLRDVFEKEKPEAVFHLAAQIDVRKSTESPIEDGKTNILGSLNVIENFIKINKDLDSLHKKIIFTSTGGAIYGDASIVPTPESYPEWPLSPYGIAKLSIDKYLNYYHKVLGLNFVSLRLGNVYGPRQNSKGEAGVVAIFCDKMLSGESPVINGSGEQTRDFVYVKDVVRAQILALESNENGFFNVGTGKESNINIIFRELKELISPEFKEIHGPSKPGEQKRSCLDSSKIKEKFGWELRYSLKEGLKETVNWFKEN